ncbi:serine protease, partial [mine drainage metagenome]
MSDLHRVRLTRLPRMASIATAIAISLSACSGGGANVQPNYTSPPPPSTAPTPPPPVIYSYPEYNQLVPTGALAAQQAGYTGKGVNIGVLDSGADPSILGLQGRLTWFNSYLANGNNTANQNDLSAANDVYGHGTVIADIVGGAAQGSGSGSFVGGVAPDSNLYIAQVCDNTGNCTPYSKAYQDLVSNGVHLFNQSWGSLTSTFATTADANGYATSMGPVYEGYGTGNVYVWAAGNNPTSSSDITVQALAPEFTPALQPQWLVAVNVQVNSAGQVTTLDPTSAQCGAAAQWCLAAPGAAMTPPVPGTKFDTGGSDGTSDSTAVITGVSAQIWQAFPWFSPGNLT